MVRLTRLLCAAAIVAASAPGGAQEKPERPRDQEPFRSGAHYVRVDAYPTRDGRAIPGDRKSVV